MNPRRIALTCCLLAILVAACSLPRYRYYWLDRKTGEERMHTTFLGGSCTKGSEFKCIPTAGIHTKTTSNGIRHFLVLSYQTTAPEKYTAFLATGGQLAITSGGATITIGNFYKQEQEDQVKVNDVLVMYQNNSCGSIWEACPAWDVRFEIQLEPGAIERLLDAPLTTSLADIRCTFDLAPLKPCWELLKDRPYRSDIRCGE